MRHPSLLALTVAICMTAPAAHTHAQDDEAETIRAAEQQMAQTPREDDIYETPEPEPTPLPSGERAGRTADRIVLEAILSNALGAAGFLLGFLGCLVEDGDADTDVCFWAGGSIGFAVGVTSGLALAAAPFDRQGNLGFAALGAVIGTLAALGLTFLAPDQPAVAWASWFTLPALFAIVAYEPSVEPVE